MQKISILWTSVLVALLVLSSCSSPVGSNQTFTAGAAVSKAVTTLQLEAESQTWTTSSGDSTSASSSAVRLQANAVGDTFSFSTSSISAGTYSISLYAANRKIYGIYSLSVNGTQIGSTTDFYSSASSDTWASSTVGTATIASGTSTFLFTVTGKNASATDYDAKIDYILLTATTATATPTTATPTPTTTATATPTPTTATGDLYVSASGSASAAGTISAPTDLATAITKIAAGHTIWLRGGTYSLSALITIAEGNNGTSATTTKNISAYGSEVPVLDFSSFAELATNRGVTLNGNYWHLTGLTVQYAGDNGIYIGGSYNTIERCITQYNRDTGLQLGRAQTTYTSISQWPHNNTILNSESHDNYDTIAGENADGFGCKLTTGVGNVFYGCISHNNIDDGWDLYAKTDTGAIGPVTITNCIAYNNGTLTNGTTNSSGDRNGFKLGGSGIDVGHIVTRCIAFGNGHHGFTDNDNQGAMTITNNTSFNNAESNYNFRSGSTSTFTNNVSLNPGSSDKFNGTLTGTTNIFWVSGKVSNNGGSLTVSTSDFQSLTKPSAGFSRNSDGSIAYGTFAKLVSTSALVNAGTPTGTDIGAIESY